jgi:hypothetical protein
MAQTNYTPIQLYYSTTAAAVPIAGNLANGELAINITDGKIYYKNNSGVVTLFGSSSNVSTVSFGTTGLTPSTATGGAITVAGTLITSNGGTGLSSFASGDLMYYSSGTAMSKLTIGTAGQILTVNSGATAPQWSTLTGVAVTTFSAGTTGFTPSTATSGAITLAGTLATTNGGTGLTSFTANGVVYASSTSALTTGSALTYDGTTLQQSIAGLYPLISVASSGNNAILGFRINNTGTNGIDWRMEEGRSAVGEFNITNITQSNAVVFKINTTGNASTFASSLLANQFIPTSASIPANGMYLPATNTLGFATNSTIRVTLDADGDLGVGTITPTSLLQTAGTSSKSAFKTPNIAEVDTISATAATGTINYDITTQSVLYYTSNASANWTVNFRGSSGTTLNSVMQTGESISATFLVTQGSTAYYNSAVTIDGTSVTPKWQGGTAPTSGNASSVDCYTYVIQKTGSATYAVLASQTKFA